MLGTNIDKVGWPNCGEIDIMENFGVTANDAALNHGTIHGPNYAGAGVGANYTLPGGAKLADDYHIYAVNWGPGSVEFLVDGVSYFKTTPASLPSGGTWVFDNNPMFLFAQLGRWRQSSAGRVSERNHNISPTDAGGLRSGLPAGRAGERDAEHQPEWDCGRCARWCESGGGRACHGLWQQPGRGNVSVDLQCPDGFLRHLNAF